MRKILHTILVGWRIEWKRLTIRLMPTRWYFGIGITLGYSALNLGPIQLFLDYHDYALRFFKGASLHS